MGIKVTDKNRLTIFYPEVALLFHQTLNNVKVSEISYGSAKLYHWKCPKGSDHEWEAPVYSLVSSYKKQNGNGCPCCSGKKVCHDNNLQTLFPEIAKFWDYRKNILTPSEVVPSSHSIFYWKCPKEIDHEWTSDPHCRTKNSGCPFCCNQRVCFSNSLASTHPELINEWDIDKNKTLTPYDIVSGSEIPIYWVCKKGHEWKTPLNYRTGKDKCGCPKCNESKGEKTITKLLDDLRIKFKPQYWFKDCRNILPLRFDFAIFNNSNLTGLIEYQGEFHYKPRRESDSPEKLKNVQHRDQIKLNYCIKTGIPLLRIPYWDKDRIEQIVKDFLWVNY